MEQRIVGPRDNSEPPGGRRDAAGLALAGIAAVAFGTLAISAKFAYRAGSPVLPLLAVRFTIAAVLIALVLAVTRRSLKIPRRAVWRLLVLGGIGYGLETLLFFAALERAPAGVVALIFYSYPLWTVLMGFATKLEPFRWRLVAALVVGSIGVGVVFSPEGGGLAGPLFALGAAVAVAVYFIAMQVMLRDVDPAPAAFWTSAGAAVTVGIGALVAGEPLPSGAVVPALALACASAFAFLTLFAAITRIGSARSAVAAMLEPIATVILAALLLDEAITARVAIGAVLIVSVLPLLAATRQKEIPAADSI